MKHDTQTKMTDESPVYIDDADLFRPPEDETVRALREELEAERDTRLRLAAEYENYRRRTKIEQANAAEQGKRELLERIVSLADDLNLALANSDESSEAVAQGWRMIERRFRSMLEANGVNGFESVGDVFDPLRHEAFDVINGTTSEPGTVHTEIRRGYFWNGKLLRPALVVVAQ